MSDTQAQKRDAQEIQAASKEGRHKRRLRKNEAIRVRIWRLFIWIGTRDAKLKV